MKPARGTNCQNPCPQLQPISRTRRKIAAIASHEQNKPNSHNNHNIGGTCSMCDTISLKKEKDSNASTDAKTQVAAYSPRPEFSVGFKIFILTTPLGDKHFLGIQSSRCHRYCYLWIAPLCFNSIKRSKERRYIIALSF